VNEKTLENIRRELESFLIGQRFGKIFSLARLALAIDFRLPDALFLFISVEPAAPRLYLISRRLRDLEKQSGSSGSFVLFLRKRLSGAVLEKIEKIAAERILIFHFNAPSELGETEKYSLAAQLTGRSANLLLLDRNGFILDRLRDTFGAGQEIGDRYAPPVRGAEKDGKPEAEKRKRAEAESFPQGDFETLSEALDAFHLEKAAENRFTALANDAENKIRQEIAKREKLVKKMTQDLAAHGDAEKWKKFGDLILANLADAVRVDGKLLVVDYFDENVPAIEIEIDENDSLTQNAEKFFRRYTKARNAKEEISKRLRDLESQIADYKSQKERIVKAIADRDEDFLRDFAGDKSAAAPNKSKDKRAENFTGARRFVSSDDYEILVGKASKDNDHLTFRVAKSQDLWLHAADYPGSHVIVKNPSRREIPPRTLLEAAQLAAFYSHAREQPKVAVHYTLKKFVNKPKGAALGLVSLSGFKTILVEPQIGEAIKNEK
jgi:predicted ribosome quality control (RQC) complex YloA/Tae2 family protein